MLKNDKQKLSLLVQEYGLKEVIKTLAVISTDEMNDAADLQLSEKTKIHSINTSYLDDLVSVINE